MLAKSRSHLILIAAGTILSALSLASIVSFTDPETTGWLTHVFLYTSLFMLCLGLCTAIGIWARQRFSSGLYVAHLGASFRQALLISILVTLSLFLQGMGLLFWWIEVTMLAFFLAIEIFLNLQ